MEELTLLPLVEGQLGQVLLTLGLRHKITNTFLAWAVEAQPKQFLCSCFVKKLVHSNVQVKKKYVTTENIRDSMGAEIYSALYCSAIEKLKLHYSTFS